VEEEKDIWQVVYKVLITAPGMAEDQVSTPSSSPIPTKALQHEMVFAVSIFFHINSCDN